MKSSGLRPSQSHTIVIYLESPAFLVSHQKIAALTRPFHKSDESNLFRSIFMEPNKDEEEKQNKDPKEHNILHCKGLKNPTGTPSRTREKEVNHESTSLNDLHYAVSLCKSRNTSYEGIGRQVLHPVSTIFSDFRSDIIKFESTRV